MLADPTEVYSGAWARFTKRQRRLFDLLGCPTCHSALSLVDENVEDNAILSGDLVCPAHGRVGVVDHYRPSFLARELESIPSGRRSTVTARAPIGGLRTTGTWTDVAEGMVAGGDAGELIDIGVDGVGVVLHFFCQDSSGIAELFVDGELAHEVDLFRPLGDFIEVPLTFEADRVHEVTILATGRRSPASKGSQVVIRRAEALVPSSRGPRPTLVPENRGNGYPPAFDDLLMGLPHDGVALDCGGGDRRHPDTRVFNLEYLLFELPDMFGDGLELPYQDDSFDLVMSQAVIEHVPDPQRAVDEMIRIIKPGGLLYMEIAFMQPLHAVPSHYFNVTPFGIEHLCRGLKIEDLSWFGGLSTTFEWLGACVNAEAKLGGDRFANLVQTLRDLDSLTTAEELKPVASAVAVRARKHQG